MTLRQPAYFQSASHPADVWRNEFAAFVSQGGVAGPYDLLPGTSPTGGMRVRFAAGSMFWVGTLPFQGVYHAVNDSFYETTLTGANPTQPRIDIVVARLKDPDFSSPGAAWDIIPLTGTPALQPTAPTGLVQPGDEVLAYASVGAAVTSLTAAKITDKRRLARFTDARDVGSKADRDALQPYNGMVIYRTDLQQRQWYMGGQWYSPVVQAADGSVRVQGDVVAFGGAARVTTDFLTVGGSATITGALSAASVNAATASVQKALQVGGNVAAGGTFLDRNGRDLLALIGLGGLNDDTQGVNVAPYQRKQGIYLTSADVYSMNGTVLTAVQSANVAMQIFVTSSDPRNATDQRAGAVAFREPLTAAGTEWGPWRRLMTPALEMWSDIITVPAQDGVGATGISWYSPNITFPSGRFSSPPVCHIQPYTTVYNNLLSNAGVFIYATSTTGFSARIDFPNGKTGACSFMASAMYQG
jgi:hypothetical protein